MKKITAKLMLIMAAAVAFTFGCSQNEDQLNPELNSAKTTMTVDNETDYMTPADDSPECFSRGFNLVDNNSGQGMGQLTISNTYHTIKINGEVDPNQQVTEVYAWMGEPGTAPFNSDKGTWDYMKFPSIEVVAEPSNTFHVNFSRFAKESKEKEIILLAKVVDMQCDQIPDHAQACDENNVFWVTGEGKRMRKGWTMTYRPVVCVPESDQAMTE